MIQAYHGFVPPCGVYCGGCPVYQRKSNGCPGAEVRCRTRRCKTIYVCCVEKRGLRHCHECASYPCSRFRSFAERWLKYGQCLHENQQRLAAMHAAEWLEDWNAKVPGDASPAQASKAR